MTHLRPLTGGDVGMPWRETSVTEERLRFVARRLEGEAMSDLCREFGISRKTGYKIFNRYKDHGILALTDRFRRPARRRRPDARPDARTDRRPETGPGPRAESHPPESSRYRAEPAG